MRRRAFAVLLVIVMVIAVLPVGVAAEETPTVYIAGTAYTSTSADALPSGVTIDWSSNTITLNNFTITNTPARTMQAMIPCGAVA